MSTAEEQERAVRMAAKIYETRDAAKLLYGAKYADLSRQYQEILRGAMKKFGTDNVLAAVPRLVKATQADGIQPSTGDILMFTAAAADIIDQETKR